MLNLILFYQKFILEGNCNAGHYFIYVELI